MKVQITYKESNDFGNFVGKLKPDNHDFSSFNYLLRQSIEKDWFEKNPSANGIVDNRMYPKYYPMIIVFLDKWRYGTETDFLSAKDWYHVSVKDASKEEKDGVITFLEFKEMFGKNEIANVVSYKKQYMRYIIKAADGTYLYSGDVFFEYTNDVFKARNFKTEITARKKVADIEKSYKDSLLIEKKTPLTVVGIEIVETPLS